MTVCVTMPGKIGDALSSLSAARTLAEKYGPLDFWTSEIVRPAFDLISAQAFIRKVVVDPGYTPEHQHCGVQPWKMQGADNNGYEKVYHLGFRDSPDRPLPDYCCHLAEVPPRPIQFDVPPSPSLAKSPYVVLASWSTRPNASEDYRDCFRWFVRHCPYPVVEVGKPGSAIATDLGSLDATSDGFLKMAQVIQGCYYFVGLNSAPMWVANGFPCVKIIPHTGAEPRHHLLDSFRNHYPWGPDPEHFLQRVRPLSTYCKTLDPYDYWSMTYETPFVDEAMRDLQGLYNPCHTHRRWEYGLILQALLRELGSLNGKRILDVGGGGSVLSAVLALQGADVTMIDTDAECEETFQKLSARFSTIHHVCDDFMNVEGHWDAITCVSVLEHVQNDKVFFKKLLTHADTVACTVDFHPEGSRRVDGHLRTYNAELMRRLTFPVEAEFETMGAPDWSDRGAHINDYNFASLCLRRKT